MEKTQSKKNFCWPVRVYHEDVDTMGIVYYANYLRFLERARSEWLRAMNIDQVALHAQDGVWLVVRSVYLDYRQSAKLDDLLDITVEIGEVTRTSVSLKQTVRCRDQELLVGEIRIVCARECPTENHKTVLRPTAFPAVLTNAWKAYL